MHVSYISGQSNVSDHCRKFVFSEPSGAECQSKCTDHKHDHVCHECEQITEIIQHIEEVVDEFDWTHTNLEHGGIVFQLQQAVSHINEWKKASPSK